MDIKKAILKEHSKAMCFKIRDYIGTNEKRFEELMQAFFSPEQIESQRAAWIVWHCFKNNNFLIEPYIEKMILNLEKPIHVAVKRNTVRILEDTDIPDHLLGIAATNCFDLLSNSSETIAVKAFSMTVLYNISKREPDLKNELKALIEKELQQPNPSKGLISRGTKILKKLF